MPSCQPLIHETRGGVIENVRYGYIAVVDADSRLRCAVGDPEELVFYRSASKPIQALPVIARGIDEKYGLTERETAIFSGSHAGEPCHVAALESIWRKTGLSEDMMIMRPTLPENEKARAAVLRAGGPKRKAYHNCSGKHTALMLLQRELTGSPEGYALPDSPAQREVRRAVAALSEYPEADVRLGVDGCGVPVFAVGIRNIAVGFKNLACPDGIADPRLRDAARRYIPRLHAYPEMVKGTDTLCTALNALEGVVAKGGAGGVYGLGLERERLGIAMKLADGENALRPLVLGGILRQLGVARPDILAVLDAMSRTRIVNDNGAEVGRAACAFQLGR